MKILFTLLIAFLSSLNLSYADDEINQFVEPDGTIVVGPIVCPEEIPTFTVFFQNGIFTDLISARLSTTATKLLIGSKFQGKDIEYKTLYNRNDGWEDLIEVFAQKVIEKEYSWEDFYEYADELVTPELLAELNRRTFAELNNINYVDDVVIRNTRTVRNELAKGRKVMIVSHSQGNLYANAIYRELSKENSEQYDLEALGFAAIASPASEVATGDGYVTSHTDLVISRVSELASTLEPKGVQILEEPLEPNDASVPLLNNTADAIVTSGFDPQLGHNYRDTYLNPNYTIRNHCKRVMENTLARIDLVETPVAIDNPIVARLDWSVGSPPRNAGNMDIQVVEPEGISQSGDVVSELIVNHDLYPISIDTRPKNLGEGPYPIGCGTHCTTPIPIPYDEDIIALTNRGYIDINDFDGVPNSTSLLTSGEIISDPSGYDGETYRNSCKSIKSGVTYKLQSLHWSGSLGIPVSMDLEIFGVSIPTRTVYYPLVSHLPCRYVGGCFDPYTFYEVSFEKIQFQNGLIKYLGRVLPAQQ